MPQWARSASIAAAMSIRRAIDRTLRQRLGLGHVTWPTFGTTVSIGDSARSGIAGYELAGLGNLLERYDLRRSDYQYVEEAPTVDVEFEDGVERQGSLAAAAKGQAPGTVKLRFSTQDAFYLFVPAARVRSVRDVDRLARDIDARSRAHGDRVGLLQRIVYKTIAAEGEGLLLVCRSRAAQALVSVGLGPGGRSTLTLGESSGELLQLRVDTSSSVFAFSVFRLALGPRRYVLDPLP